MSDKHKFIHIAAEDKRAVISGRLRKPNDVKGNGRCSHGNCTAPKQIPGVTEIESTMTLAVAPVAQQTVFCRPGFAASRARLGADTQTQVLFIGLPDVRSTRLSPVFSVCKHEQSTSLGKKLGLLALGQPLAV